MPLFSKLFALLFCSMMLNACSSNDDDEPAPEISEPPPPPPVRGSLIENPPPRTASIASADLFATLSAGTAGEQILELITAPECDIDVHQLSYNTVDVADASTTASGALMIPTGSDPACQGPRPIVIYAHGTQVVKSFNIANLADPDNAEGLLIAAAFAAQGYIVVAPNYAGFDTSALPYHAFLHADQQSRDTADALAAARSALPTSFAPSVTDSGALFITGYSQGGYVAMATHRLLQETGVAVTASAPMSGPYALSAQGDAVFYGNVVASAPLFLAYLVTGYQRAYGNVYTNPTDVFEAPFATDIETLLPTAGSRSELFDQGRLPADQAFSSTPPHPSYAPYTPSTTPAELAHVFALGFGPEPLITNAFRLAYLQDAQTNPDGGFPTVTDGLPPASPANGLRQAFKENDLRNWTPAAPVLLCAGNEDPTVHYLNTQLMENYWTSVGAPNVRVLDLDDDPSLDDPEVARKAGFEVLKAAIAAEAIANGATDNGAAAVADVYHSMLVPPFCLSAVKSFFDGL